MKAATERGTPARRLRKPETVVIFAVARQMFAIAADAIQEIRSTDSLAGAANEIEQPDLPKVAHHFERGRQTYYVVNAGKHFGLPVSRPTLVLILRQRRAAVLVDRIERMTEISALHPLPLAFGGEERRWYRCLAYVDDAVIPVVDPSGFLTAGELKSLDEAMRTAEGQREMEGAVQ
jgi:chemotaxis signal transduction protein